MMVLWVPARLRELIEAEASRAHPLETGGVLMGYWNGRSAVVTDVIGPGPYAHHEPDSFEHDAAWQHAEIVRIYAASGRLHAYLGDWHTHPNGALGMSATDRETLRRVATTPEARAPRAVSLIAAGAPARWRLGAWCGVGAEPLLVVDAR